MSITSFAALFGTGLLAGVLGAMLGLGGGIFLVPALTLFFHLPMRVAVSTSLVGVLATSAGTAAVAPRGRGADIPLALRLEMATTAGALAGSLAAGRVGADVLSILFAVVVFCVAGYMGYKALRRPARAVPETLFRTDYQVRHWPWGLFFSGLAGAISGMLGVGGGFIKVPVMYAMMDVPLGIATATSNFMVGITAAASFFIYFQRGDVHPIIAIPIALGVFAGAVLGVYILPRLRAAWLRLGLIGLLVVMGIQMLLRGIGGGA